MLRKILSFIVSSILRYLIKELKYLSNYINISIKYLSGSNRFSYINKNLKLIKGIIILLRCKD